MSYHAVTDVLYAIVLTLDDQPYPQDSDKMALKRFVQSLPNDPEILSDDQIQTSTTNLSNNLANEWKNVYEQKLAIVQKFSPETKAQFTIKRSELHRLTGVQFAPRPGRSTKPEGDNYEHLNTVALGQIIDNHLYKMEQTTPAPTPDSPTSQQPDLSPISGLFQQP